MASQAAAAAATYLPGSGAWSAAARQAAFEGHEPSLAGLDDVLREIDDGSGSNGNSGSDDSDSDSDDCGQGNFGRGARGWGSGPAGAGALLSEHWSAAAFQAPYLLPAEVAAGAHHRLLGSSEGAEEGGKRRPLGRGREEARRPFSASCG